MMVAFTRENGELYLFHRRGETSPNSGIPIGADLSKNCISANDSKSGNEPALLEFPPMAKIVRINFKGESDFTEIN